MSNFVGSLQTCPLTLWLYSDEDEHRHEIDELWQQRQQRLNVFVKPNEQWQACLNHCHGEKRSDDIQQQKSKMIMSVQQNNSPIQAAVNALNGLCAFSRSE